MPATEIANPLETALRHHRAGSLAVAEQLYGELLSANPENHAILNLLGVIAGQTGRLEQGVRLIEQAIRFDCTIPAYHNNLGNLLREQGRLEEAIDAYRNALRLQGNYAEARANLGLALRQSQRLEEAADQYRRALELKHDWADVLIDLADVLHDCGRLHEAAEIYERAIGVNPDSSSLRNNYGMVLRDLGRFEPAIEQYRHALTFDSQAAEIWNNLGVALADGGHLVDSIEAFQRAISLKPEYSDAHANLGATLFADRQPVPAISACRKAVELDPQNAKAHSNLGLVLLGCGEYEQGWPEHEWRYRCSPMFVRRDFAQPQWDGRPLDGKTILLHAEQGFGDTIHFCRFVSQVVQRGGDAVLEVQPELVRLLRHAMPNVPVIARGEPLPGFDVHCPLLSLPYVLRTTASTIPRDPYLRAERIVLSPAPGTPGEGWGGGSVDSVARKSPLPTLPRSTGGGNKELQRALKVGVVWGGRPTHTNDRNRSIPVQALGPLGNVSGVEFHSLQRGPAAAQLFKRPPEFEIVEHDLTSADFLNTANLIAKLDLVISVDTAVAHLAGAMGKSVWLMLPYAADWRWMLDREDTPWYPSMRLFRQQRWGDWDDVVNRVAWDLAGLACRGNPISSMPVDPSSSA